MPALPTNYIIAKGLFWTILLTIFSHQHLAEVRTTTGQLSLLPEVSRLVDYVWTEATDRLEDVLAVTVETISQDQLDKAEAALLSIRRELEGEKDAASEIV